MSVTYKASVVQPKLIGNGRSLIPVTFNICGNVLHSVCYHSWVPNSNFLFNRVNFNSRPRPHNPSCIASTPIPPPLHLRLPPTSLLQPSSPPHPSPPRSETLAKVLPAVAASVDQDSQDLHASMPWRLPTASGPHQRALTVRSAPCAATPLRQIRVLAGHGALSRTDLSSLAPKLLPPLLLCLPPSLPLPLFDPRDGKIAGAGSAGISPHGLGLRCAVAEEQRSSPCCERANPVGCITEGTSPLPLHWSPPKAIPRPHPRFLGRVRRIGYPYSFMFITLEYFTILYSVHMLHWTQMYALVYDCSVLCFQTCDHHNMC
jgi:hypothetical protein